MANIRTLIHRLPEPVLSALRRGISPFVAPARARRSAEEALAIERRAVAFYSDLIEPGDVVFDVGAHTGSRTRVFRQLGARVVAVEPQPACVASLQQQFGMDDHVSIVAEGLASVPGSMRLMTNSHSPMIATMADHWQTGRFAGEQWDDSVDVPVTTLDHLIETFGLPNFCKVDVEGFESEVLRGLTRRLRTLSLEFTREFLADTVSQLSTLSQLGAIECNVSLAETMTWGLPTWLSPDELVEILRKWGNQNADLWGDIYVRFLRA